MAFVDTVDAAQPQQHQRFEFSLARDYLRGQRVLDVGCWTGEFEAFARGLATRMVAVDVERRALSVLHQQMPEVPCCVAAGYRLPFPDGSFDVVTLWGVLEHLPIGYELATLQELGRVLVGGGRLFLMTMQKNLLSDLLDPAYWVVGHRHYATAHLQALLVDAGYVVEEIRFTGSFATAAGVLAFYGFKHVLHTRPPRSLYRMVERGGASRGFCYVTVRARKPAT